MACFLVPATEAAITTIASKIISKNEPAPESIHISLDGTSVTEVEKIPFSRKLKWLNNLLWGGSALLAFEHLWHGEIVPWFPFLTAAGNSVDAAQMLHEMATVGVAMSVLVTAVWAGMLGLSKIIEKKAVDGANRLLSTKRRES